MKNDSPFKHLNNSRDNNNNIFLGGLNLKNDNIFFVILCEGCVRPKKRIGREVSQKDMEEKERRKGEKARTTEKHV